MFDILPAVSKIIALNSCTLALNKTLFVSEISSQVAWCKNPEEKSTEYGSLMWDVNSGARAYFLDTVGVGEAPVNVIRWHPSWAGTFRCPVFAWGGPQASMNPNRAGILMHEMAPHFVWS